MSHEFEGQRHERTSLILYGSETGNGQDAAEQLGRNLERLRFATTVVEMDSVEIVCSNPAKHIKLSRLTNILLHRRC